MTADYSGLPLSLSIAKAAELMGVSRSTAYAAANRGDIPTIRINGRLVVPTAKLLAMFGAEYHPNGKENA